MCTLTGAALRSEATRLNIPGRSKLTADQLRAAVRAALIEAYRAACTAYATNPAPAAGNGPRLRQASDALEAAGIPHTDVPPPPAPRRVATIAQVAAAINAVTSPDWARTCYGCLVVTPTDGDMVTGLVRYRLDDHLRPLCRPCAALPLGTRPTEQPDYAPETYTRPVWGDTPAPVAQVADDTPWDLAPVDTADPRCPITGDPDCRDRYCELHYMGAPLRLAPVPFRATGGKRKRSAPRIHRRTRAI